MKKKIPTFKSDRAAAAFVRTADLTPYDLSGAQLTSFKRYRQHPDKPRRLTPAEARRLDAAPIDYSDIPPRGDMRKRKNPYIGGKVEDWLKEEGIYEAATQRAMKKVRPRLSASGMKNPPHPGDFVRTEILHPAGLSVTAAAAALGVSRYTLSRVLNGRARLSVDMALRFEKAGWSHADLWLRMQIAYDLAHGRRGRIKVRRL